MTLTFKKAGLDQIQEALHLFRITSAELTKKGLTQWSYWADPPEEKIQWVRDGFEKGEFHFVYDESLEWVGIFRLLEVDTLYWEQRGLEKDARYVHSLVVKPERHGEGIGARVLQNLVRSLKRQDVRKLRLDCDASNSKLCSYYEELGFVRVGEKRTPFSLNNLYERNL